MYKFTDRFYIIIYNFNNHGNGFTKKDKKIGWMRKYFNLVDKNNNFIFRFANYI
jgi:hypothetical protein